MLVVLVSHGYSEWFQRHEISTYGPFDDHQTAEDFMQAVRDKEIELDSLTGQVESMTIVTVREAVMPAKQGVRNDND